MSGTKVPFFFVLCIGAYGNKVSQVYIIVGFKPVSHCAKF
jgi:hypothetical protein